MLPCVVLLWQKPQYHENLCPPSTWKYGIFLPREWKLVVGRSLGRSCRSRRGCWLSYYFSFQKSTLIWAEKNWFATSYWFGAKIVTFYIQTFCEVFISQDGILGPRISGVCANIILSRSSLCWFPEEKTREWLDNFFGKSKTHATTTTTNKRGCKMQWYPLFLRTWNFIFNISGIRSK